MFKDIGMERDTLKPAPTPTTFPTTGFEINLTGTPSEILSSLIAMVPTVLDFEKTYRFTVKAGRFLELKQDRERYQ